MRSRKQFLGWPVSTIFFSANGIAIIVVLVLFSKSLMQEKTVTYTEITQQQWYKASTLERTDWLNRSKQVFNIKYQGEIQSFTEKFEQEGWVIEKPKAWKSVWNSLNADMESEKIEMIPTTHNGKIDSYIVTRQQENQLMALHLWKEPMKISGTDSFLYSGYFTNNEVVKNWGMTYWQNTEEEIDNSYLIKSILKESFEISEQNEQYFIKSR
jgi:hypothetical protein